ncbi:Cytochrome B561 [gamma proteobacterium IMCC2047]|nr:Cytochrome B561 [gamma proteobacterium IMCC2047]
MITAIRNTRARYGLAAIGLHWLMALIIIGMYPLGLYIDTLGYYDAAYRTVPHWHKSIGMILLGLLLVRLLWRMLSSQPKTLTTSVMQKRVIKLVHASLYLLMLVALLSGYLISTADGRGIDVFNWFTVPALPSLIENQEDVAGLVHYWATTLLISMAGLHTLAALKHHFINKDQTLLRMLGSSKTSEISE